MNYFELFDIPIQLKVNAASLSGKFFELSRKYHPDHFANENEQAQAEALEMSALLNKAWKTFQNPDASIKYVLQLKGLLEEEEKYELPPEFLMEVIEINEGLMDDVIDPELEKKIITLQSEIYEPVKEIVESYQETAIADKELLQVKEYYFKKKYIDRIRLQLIK